MHGQFQVLFTGAEEEGAVEGSDAVRHHDRHACGAADGRHCIVAVPSQLCRHLVCHHPHVDLGFWHLADFIRHLNSLFCIVSAESAQTT